ncbi:EPM2A (laforin) interacting protein 1, variant 2 [Dermatophagoides farinae]|uniref:EPM2A (Laforin) interacting protein 1, variant 2 n=1 Tax=Dermatophagoides farinae TaxID=6954 RepID=A0A922L6T0_DERFA|nr:EPM2A (laforin) interacting protein 1, variant 2 [Dermatophagoides farinae]
MIYCKTADRIRRYLGCTRLFRKRNSYLGRFFDGFWAGKQLCTTLIFIKTSELRKKWNKAGVIKFI